MTALRDVTPDMLAKVRAAYVGREGTVRDITERFRLSYNQLYKLVAKHGWPVRGNIPKTSPGKERAKAAKSKRVWINPFSPAALAAEARKIEERRDRTLYGDAVDDVAFLRRLGFVINRERGGVRVGNRLVDIEGLKAIAARERRLRMAVSHSAHLARSSATPPNKPTPRKVARLRARART